MVMYLPLEIVHRDSLGALENKSTSTTYAVEIVLAKSTDIYSTSPTTLGTVRCRTVLDSYTEPAAVDHTGLQLASAPPISGTIQYWRSENVVQAAGAGDNVQRNGLGFSIRNIVYKFLDTNNSRAGGDADWPDPAQLTYGRIVLFNRFKKIWISKMAKAYGLTSASTDVSLGRENGVYPVWFTDDFGFRPGAELRNGYLVTQLGEQLEWTGTIGGSGNHKLFTLTNWVVPPGNNSAAVRKA